MSDNNDFGLATVFMIFLLAFVIFMVGCSCGESHAIREKEKEAVVKGHAIWVADKDGKSTFQWKEASK
jgi:hypothetical protein